MPLESFAEPEVAVAAAVVAVAASPSLRQVVRRSVVYGLAGALIAYDRSSAAAQGIVRGVHGGISSLTPNTNAAPAGASQPAPSPQQPSPIANILSLDSSLT